MIFIVIGNHLAWIHLRFTFCSLGTLRMSGRLWCRARSGYRRRWGRRFRRSSFFFFLFSCMCTRHTWMSLEQLCLSEFFLRFVFDHADWTCSFASILCYGKICKNKTLRLLRIPPKLILIKKWDLGTSKSPRKKRARRPNSWGDSPGNSARHAATLETTRHVPNLSSKNMSQFLMFQPH